MMQGVLEGSTITSTGTIISVGSVKGSSRRRSHASDVSEGVWVTYVVNAFTPRVTVAGLQPAFCECL